MVGSPSTVSLSRTPNLSRVRPNFGQRRRKVYTGTHSTVRLEVKEIDIFPPVTSLNVRSIIYIWGTVLIIYLRLQLLLSPWLF